jgi:hypothetical protein
MKNLLSLTKVGNLKIGIVRNGKPIATERILVTTPTKENEENFKILRGFNEEGEEEVNVTLPFDDINLNFEVNYVSFATINEIEYILKAQDFGDKILAYPLNPEDFDKKIIDMGELSNEKIEHFGMRRTGFLKVHLNGYSSFGEVFYYKTSSINTIRAITDQLKILSALTNGKIAGIPLVMRPIKKDVNEKQIVFISIGFKGGVNHENFNILGGNLSLSDFIEKRKHSKVNYAALEDLYKESRTPIEEEIEAFENLKNAKIEVDKNTEAEIKEIENEAEKKEKGPEEIFVKEFFKEKEITAIPLSVGVGLFKSMKTEEEFKEYFEEEKTLADVVKTMRNIK